MRKLPCFTLKFYTSSLISGSIRYSTNASNSPAHYSHHVFYMFTGTISIKTCYGEPSTALILLQQQDTNRQKGSVFTISANSSVTANSSITLDFAQVNGNARLTHTTQYTTKTLTVIINFPVIIQHTALKYQSLDIGIYFLHVYTSKTHKT